MQNHTSDGTVEQRRSVLTTLALGLSTFLILFDVTAVVVAMPAISNDVGLGVAGLAWVIDAYSLRSPPRSWRPVLLPIASAVGGACWPATRCFSLLHLAAGWPRASRCS